MINLKEVHLYPNRYVDGQLDDGRLVEFKTKIPSQLDNLIRIVVAMANTAGGFIIFGVDERTLSVVGTGGNINQQISNLETAIKTLSLGIDYLLTHEVVDGKDVVTLEIKKAESTAYFSRVETTPARQFAYRYDREKEMTLSKEEMRYTNVFKYMTLDAFLTSLYCKSWRFFEPSKWNDKFEQRFYCASYTLPEAMGNTPQLFASCLTRKRNSEAAWKVYSHGQGLGAHCIQLELDIAELRKQLRASGFRFEEMPVEYMNEKVILSLHKKGDPSYNKYFSSFTLESFLRLLSLKRKAYEYEEELRLFIIPKNGGKRNGSKNAQYQDIKIDWSKVISKVRVDKKCSDAELVSIQRACFSVGINPIINQYSFIGSIVPPPGLKDVEFVRFDIDDMPGAKSIIIV